MMLTRRNALTDTITAGTVMRTRTGFAKASQPATPINFDVPENACDCHTHIHADPEQFPFFTGRVYTPELASPEEMSALHRALKVKRVVIVTPSVYGTDNSATLFGMKARGADARGVAVIDDRTSESDLDAMAWHPAQSRDRRRQRPQRRASTLPDRRRPDEKSRLARPDVHQPGGNLRDKGPGADFARSRGLRPFWRRSGSTRACNSLVSQTLPNWFVPARFMSKFPALIVYRRKRPTMRTSQRSPRH
jgi:Amidohydrolase